MWSKQTKATFDRQEKGQNNKKKTERKRKQLGNNRVGFQTNGRVIRNDVEWRRERRPTASDEPLTDWSIHASKSPAGHASDVFFYRFF